MHTSTQRHASKQPYCATIKISFNVYKHPRFDDLGYLHILHLAALFRCIRLMLRSIVQQKKLMLWKRFNHLQDLRLIGSNYCLSITPINSLEKLALRDGKENVCHVPQVSGSSPSFPSAS